MEKQRSCGRIAGAVLLLISISCIGVRNSSKSLQATLFIATKQGIATEQGTSDRETRLDRFADMDSKIAKASFIPEHTSPIYKSVFTLFRNATNRTTALLSYHPSPKQVWETLKRDLVQESIALVNKLWNQADNPNVAAGFHDMMNLLSPERLRKSLVHPMPIADATKLVEIVRLRLEDPTKHPPLEIIALGGSVARGAEALGQTFGLYLPYRIRKRMDEEPAWANTLGRFLNNGLFHGKDVVHVQNLAVRGTTSDIGAMLVEYGFFQTPGIIPDIVITAHSPNDHLLDFNKQLEVGNQLVKAIKTMRCDGLPIQISFVDPVDGGPENKVKFLGQAQTQAVLTHWYDFMGLSFEKVFHDVSIRDMPIAHKGEIGTFNGTYTRYWGNPWWNCHPGTIHHSAVSWLFTISLANAFVDACEYAVSSSLTTVTADTTTGNTTSAAWSLSHLPPLKSGADYFEVYNEWNKTQIEHDAKCQRMQREDRTSITKTCEYKWVNTPQFGVDSKKAADAVMGRVMISNNGWYAEGGKNRFAGGEKPGWVTTVANADS